MTTHLYSYRDPSDQRRGSSPRRRGSITVLAAVVFSALLIVAGLTINLTQVATVRTELRLAADAASKAGAIVLGQTQDVNAARRAAKQIAGAHYVNNRRMLLYNIDVDFGYGEKQDDGSFEFQENIEPYNAVKVQARLEENSRAGLGTFFMAGILNPGNFSVRYDSVATRVDHDLCLVVDRSGSMAWDTSDEPWTYPVHDEDGDGEPDVSDSIIQNYFLPPHAEDSRWAALVRSTDVFFDYLESLPVDVQTGLVSYSSNFVFGLYESDASTVHSELTDDYDLLRESMLEIGTEPLIGNTNTASGMQRAVEILTGNESRLTAKGTMVVLTDGIVNQGVDPEIVAAAAASANVTVHTITFGEQADQDAMRRFAIAGGGNHYHAANEAALDEVFAEIAETLPAVLMQ